LQITTQVSGVAPPQFTGNALPMPWVWTGFGALVAIGFVVLRKTESRSLRFAFSAVLLAAALMLQGACTEGRKSTPPGTYSITITATSGATVRSTVLTLNVQ